MKKIVMSLIVIMSLVLVLMPSAMANFGDNCRQTQSVVVYYAWQYFPESVPYAGCRSYCWAMGYECWRLGDDLVGLNPEQDPDLWSCVCGFIV